MGLQPQIGCSFVTSRRTFTVRWDKPLDTKRTPLSTSRCFHFGRACRPAVRMAGLVNCARQPLIGSLTMTCIELFFAEGEQ